MLETTLAVAAATWGVVMALAPLLQIRRMLRRRSSGDVSITYLAILVPGFMLWIGYGITISSTALIVPNTVAVLVASVTIVVALQLRPWSSRWRRS